MGVHHVEVALAHWDIDRLTHRATRMMDVRRHVRQLDEVLKILDGCISTAIINVIHKRGAIVWSKHCGIATYLHIVFRITSMLRVNARCTCLHDCSAHSTRKPNSSAVNNCTSIFESLNRAWVITNLDTNLKEDCVCIALEQRKAFFRNHFIRRNQASQIRVALSMGCFTCCLTSGSAAASPVVLYICHNLAPF